MTTGRINQVTVVRPRSPQSQTARTLPKEPQTISPKARRARVVSTRSSLVKACFYIAHSVTRCEVGLNPRKLVTLTTRPKTCHVANVNFFDCVSSVHQGT